MSCSTNCRIVSALRAGSILSEFVLVMPIYAALLGGLFLIGDMGLNAVRITIGDRDAAMDSGDRSGHSRSKYLSNQMTEESSKVYSDSRTYRVDENFRGSWLWQAAGRDMFAYKVQSWGGALLSYPFLNYGDATKGAGVLRSLIGGGVVLFHSKDYTFSGKNRKYNYYTIKRTDLARDPAAYRNWDSQEPTFPERSKLTKINGGRQYWFTSVYLEDDIKSCASRSDPDNLDASNQGQDELPSKSAGRSEYERVNAYVKWSQ